MKSFNEFFGGFFKGVSAASEAFSESGIHATEIQDEKQLADFTRGWLKEIAKARKREETYRKIARDTIKIYEPNDSDETPFNILYSNTETLAPSLYNATPRPVVSRRYKTPDPVAELAAKVSEMLLSFQIDTNSRDYSSFDSLMRYAVLQGLVPGRGVVWFKYDAQIENYSAEHETPSPLPEEQNGEVESPEPAAQVATEPLENVVAEQVCWEEVSWDRITYGFADSWAKVPWLARIHFMTPSEVRKSFGDAWATELKYDTATEVDSETSNDEVKPSKEAKDVKLAAIYEIWDKVTRRVIFIAAGTERPIKVKEDPLKLSGFFPCPQPLQFFQRVSSLTPIPIYMAYRQQAKELNEITRRISKLTTMLKVRGFYDGSLQNLQDLLSSADGTLIAADNVAALMQGQSLANSIWMFPIQDVINTLRELHAQRDVIKRTIYEINGIADIMRGSSVASETLGAQEIKNQWGTLRLKRMQKSVMEFVRESLRIILEIGSSQFSQETLQKMTGFDLPTAEMKMQMQMQMQQAQAEGREIPPEVQMHVQNFMATPTWEDVIALLRDDPTRQYKIDIETNSTIDLEATEDKQQVTEFFNAIAQFLNGMSPMVQEGILPFEAAKSMLLAGARKFRFGVEVEDSLKQMKAPAPKQPEGQAPPDPATQAAQQTAIAAEQAKQQTIQMQMELDREEHAFKMQELKQKTILANAQHAKAMSQVEAPHATL